MADMDQSNGAMLADSHRNAQRLVNHLESHMSRGRAAQAPDPKALASAIRALKALDEQLQKESASK